MRRNSGTILFLGLIVIILTSTMVVNAGFSSSRSEQIVKSEESLNLEIEEKLVQTQPQQSSNKYAVIMVGRYFGIWNYGHPLWNYNMIQQYYTWYLTDAAHMYTTLIDTNGYDVENVYLLVKLLPESLFTVPEVFNTSWPIIESNEQNLENVLAKFRPGGEKEMAENDKLFVCFIDHGGSDKIDDYTYGWFSPSDRIDNLWDQETKAYDDDSNTYTTFSKSLLSWPQAWSQELILKFDDPVMIKGFRIYASNNTNHDLMAVVPFRNNQQVTDAGVTFDKWTDEGWSYHEYKGEEHEVDMVKISFHKNSLLGFLANPAKVMEFDFLDVAGDGAIGQTYFGCPLDTIPEFLQVLFGQDVERLYDYELREYVGDNSLDERIKGTIIYLLHPCNSGGFINEMSGDKRIILTGSRGFEETDDWIAALRQALNKEHMDATDLNDDDRISILEAYRYAAEDYVTQNGTFHPLLDDNCDGVGHTYYETNYYDPSTSGYEGYIADHTFLD